MTTNNKQNPKLDYTYSDEQLGAIVVGLFRALRVPPEQAAMVIGRLFVKVYKNQPAGQSKEMQSEAKGDRETKGSENQDNKEV